MKTLLVVSRGINGLIVNRVPEFVASDYRLHFIEQDVTVIDEEAGTFYHAHSGLWLELGTAPSIVAVICRGAHAWPGAPDSGEDEDAKLEFDDMERVLDEEDPNTPIYEAMDKEIKRGLV